MVSRRSRFWSLEREGARVCMEGERGEVKVYMEGEMGEVTEKEGREGETGGEAGGL